MPPCRSPRSTERRELSCDVLVIGGGTAGTMAAITAAEAGADVLLLEKAHVRHSGALAMGMDGVNNAVIPGKATPEDYVAEITRANDGIVNQRTIRQTATRGYAMVQRLEKYGVKFEKDEYGEYAVRRVHRSGSYVLPMPEGKDVKKVLYRVLRKREIREQLRIENRVMPVRVLTAGGRAVGAAGVRHPHRRVRHRRGRRGHPRHRRLRPARPARQRLPLRHLREPDQRRRRLRDGLPRRRRAQRHRVLPGQPADQGLQRPGLRLRRQPVRRLPGQRRGRPVRRLRLLVGPDDGRGQGGDRLRPRPDLPQAHATCPTRRSPTIEGILHHTERPTRGTFHAGPRPRLPHPRRGDAHLRDRPVRRPLRPPACGSTRTRRPPCPACTPPATWPACRTTT